MTTPEVIDPGLIAAARHYADAFPTYRMIGEVAQEPDWFYVHTYEDGSRKGFYFAETLTLIANLLEKNEIDFLKMRHLRKVGGDLIDDMLRARR